MHTVPCLEITLFNHLVSPLLSLPSQHVMSQEPFCCLLDPPQVHDTPPLYPTKSGSKCHRLLGLRLPLKSLGSKDFLILKNHE